MKMPDLLAYLLQHRFRYSSSTIIDVLSLADLLHRVDPWQRIQVGEVCELLGVTSTSYVSHRLKRLERAGLLEYQAGVPHDPGYLFLRVGPEA